MKGFIKFMMVVLIFFLGTLSLVHVDRQCSQLNRTTPIIEKLIDK